MSSELHGREAKNTGMLLLAACLILSGVPLEGCEERKEDLRREVTWMKVNTLTDVAIVHGVLSQEGSMDFPSGDVKAFYRWMTSEDRRDSYLEYLLSEYPLDEVNQTFYDNWGRPLVYRFPSASVARMFDLYSVGPNGRDEEGTGDDVACFKAASFAQWSEQFSAASPDREWLVTNYGKLGRGPDGKIGRKAE